MQRDRIEQWLIVLVIAGILVLTTVAFFPLLGIVLFALSVAMVSMPLHRWFLRYMRPSFSAVLVTACVGLVLTVCTAATVAVLIENSGFIQLVVQTILNWVVTAQGGSIPLGIPVDAAQVTSEVNDLIAQFTTSLRSWVEQVPGLLMDVVIFFLALYLFLEQGERLWLEILRNIPARGRRVASRFSEMAVDTMYSVYVVHLAIAVVTFFISIPFFMVLGYEHVLFFSLLCGVFQLVPFLGQTVVLLFVGGYALALGDIRGILLVIFIGYPIAAIPDVVMRPLLMGQKVQVHAAILFIGFFGGIAVMGAIGFVLGPLLMALLVAAYKIAIEEFGAGPDGDKDNNDSG
ncbi:AI-2E family transporter [Methanosphaerula subterraneus]|uniref:AI-2E family transporter n=1 Tax=Methanosphaerula subterraneus TaxID=3350244 RepID=UPI003F86FDBC